MPFTHSDRRPGEKGYVGPENGPRVTLEQRRLNLVNRLRVAAHMIEDNTPCTNEQVAPVGLDFIGDLAKNEVAGVYEAAMYFSFHAGLVAEEERLKPN